jgi:hypothetical protein
MMQAQGNFNYGWGNNPNNPTMSADFLGANPYGPSLGYSAGLSGLGAAHNIFNTVNTAGMFAGMASGFGIGGSGLANFGRIAGGLGFGGMVMPMLAPMAVGHAFGAAVHGAQQQNAIHNIMNQSFGNRNMGGYGGSGFSGQSAQMMTETIRSMAAIPDMLTNQNELTNIFRNLNSMKLLQASKNAKEMGDKFSTIVKTMKDMARELNTTLENVMPYIEQFNNQGYFHMKDIRRGSSMTRATSAVGIGMNEQNLIGLQQSGADLVRGYGGRSMVGSELMRDMAGQVSIGVQKGLISEERLFNVTGKRGEEAVGEMSKKMMAANARIMQSDAGKILSAALGKKNENGEFTGEIDKDLLEKFNSGALSSEDIKSLYSSKLDSSQAAVSLQNNMSRGMGAEFGAKMGVGGLAKAAKALLKDSNLSDEEIKLWLKNTIQEDQIVVDAIFEMSDKSKGLEREFERQVGEVQKKNRMMSALRERSLGAKYQKFKTSVGHIISSPFESMGGDYMTQFSEAGELASHDFANGRYLKATGRMIGGFFGIQPTHVRGKLEGISDEVVASAMMGDTGRTTTNNFSEATDEGVNKFLNTSRFAQNLDIIGGIKDTFDETEMRDYNARKFFGTDRKNITADYLAKREGQKSTTKSTRFIRDYISKALSSGKTVSEIIRGLKENMTHGGGDIYGQLQALESEGGGLGKLAGEVRQGINSQITSGMGSATSEERIVELTKQRNSMFGSNYGVGFGGAEGEDIIDQGAFGGVNDLDSNVLQEIFRSGSQVSIQKQQGYAQLMNALSSDDKMDIASALRSGDDKEIQRVLDSKGIKLSASDLQGATRDEFLKLAGEVYNLDAVGKHGYQQYMSKLTGNLSEQALHEKGTARTDLFKYTMDKDFGSTEYGKMLSEYASKGDISKLDALTGSLTEDKLKGMEESSGKDLMVKLFAEKQRIAGLSDDEVTNEAKAYLSDDQIKELGMSKLRTRMTNRVVLQAGKASSDKDTDELIMATAGYSAEVAEAIAQANETTARYMSETSNAITKQEAFNKTTAEAIVKISNSVKTVP